MILSKLYTKCDTDIVKGVHTLSIVNVSRGDFRGHSELRVPGR